MNNNLDIENNRVDQSASINEVIEAFSILKKFCGNAGAGVKITSSLYDIEKFIFRKKYEINNQQNHSVFSNSSNMAINVCKRIREDHSNEENKDITTSGIGIKKRKIDSLSSLEDLSLRFPGLMSDIYMILDKKSLLNLKTTSRYINRSLEENRIFWVRKLKTQVKKNNSFYESWKKVVKKTPAAIIKEIINSIEDFFIYFTKACHTQLCPLHIAAFLGNLKLTKHIVEKTKEYCPKNKYGWTPLHFAVLRGQLKIGRIKSDLFHYESTIEDLMEKICLRKKSGIRLEGAPNFRHLDVCELIMEKIENKNPADDIGWTPLHLAAFNGHLDLTKLIIEKIDYNNLVSNLDIMTPIHWAAYKGHSEVCKVIIEKAHERNPSLDGENGNTALHLAVFGGKFEGCKVLVENIIEKNPKNSAGFTPFHEAVLEAGFAKTGGIYSDGSHYQCFERKSYLKICKLFIDNVKDKHPVSDRGETPKDIAEKSGDVEILNMFEN